MPFRDGVSDDLVEEQVEERSIVSAEEHSALEGVVLIALTALALIVGRVLHRNHVFGLPESGATILIGLVCGLCVHYISPIEAAYEQKLYFNPEFFNLFLLPPIIFESGFSLNQTLFFRHITTICTFAVVGTLISTACMWTLIYLAGQYGIILQLTMVEAGAFAALISAVDPVATLATFSALRVDPQLHNFIFGESVLNDAVSIVLFRSIVAFYLDEFYAEMHLPRVLLSFAMTAVLSAIIGFSFAVASALTFKGLRMAHEGSAAAVTECALFWTFSYLSFVVADVFGLSGIVSTLFAGIFSARYVTPNLTSEGLQLTRDALRVLATVADTLVFMLVGLAIVVYNVHYTTSFSLFIVAFAGCIVSRALNIFPLAFLLNCWTACKSRRRQRAGVLRVADSSRRLGEDGHVPIQFQVVMWFSGLRGAIAVALSVQLPGPRKGPIVVGTMLVVVATILVLGGGTKRLLDKLRIETGAAPSADRELLRLTGARSDSVDLSAEGAQGDSGAQGDYGSSDGPSDATPPRRSRMRALERRFVLRFVVDRTIPGYRDNYLVAGGAHQLSAAQEPPEAPISGADGDDAHDAEAAPAASNPNKFEDNFVPSSPAPACAARAKSFGTR